MNRRVFLRALGILAAASTSPLAAAAPSIAEKVSGPVHKFALKRMGPKPEQIQAVINPDWVEAPYELVFFIADYADCRSSQFDPAPVRFRNRASADWYFDYMAGKMPPEVYWKKIASST
jgi:hypothetical protein